MIFELPFVANCLTIFGRWIAPWHRRVIARGGFCRSGRGDHPSLRSRCAPSLGCCLAAEPGYAATPASPKTVAAQSGTGSAQQTRSSPPAVGADSSGTSTASNAQLRAQCAPVGQPAHGRAATLDADLIELPGISDDVSVSVTLSYSSADATLNLDANITYFGLPYGWKYNIPLSTIATRTARSSSTGRNPTPLIRASGRSLRHASSPVSAYTGLLEYNRATRTFAPTAGRSLSAASRRRS